MPPVINREECIGCKKCVQICTMDILGVDENQKPTVLYPDECWHCRACVLDCPVGAIDMRYPMQFMLLHADVTQSAE